jgi:hypothetical protein
LREQCHASWAKEALDTSDAAIANMADPKITPNPYPAGPGYPDVQHLPAPQQCVA